MSAFNKRHLATRSHPVKGQVGFPLRAAPCQCTDEPFGDERDGTCARCGRQVQGYEIRAAGVFALGIGSDRSTFAVSKRKYRPAA